MAKIQAHPDIKWHHVPTKENPADLGSRGGQLTPLWLKGPSWLQDEMKWPPNPVIKPTSETQEEAKAMWKVLPVAVQNPVDDPYLVLLEKYPLKKTLRIGSWMQRFVDNSRRTATERSGERRKPLTTEELENQRRWWIKRVQEKATEESKFVLEKTQLNL